MAAELAVMRAVSSYASALDPKEAADGRSKFLV